jgi:hypothetical protein
VTLSSVAAKMPALRRFAQAGTITADRSQKSREDRPDHRNIAAFAAAGGIE